MEKLGFKISKLLLAIISLLLLIGCWNKRKTVDWSATFDSKDKIPYGTYICYDQMKTLFPDSDIDRIGYKLNQYLDEKYTYNEILTYIDDFPNLDSLDKQSIRTFVRRGNIYFQSSTVLPMLNDSLSIYTSNKNIYGKEISEKSSAKTLRLKDEFSDEKKYVLDKLVLQSYFDQLPESAVVLGTVAVYGKQEPNFIKIPYGQGWFYLHAEPYVFTNIALLDNEVANYTQDVFSFLPDQDILWNNYRIESRKYREKSEGDLPGFISFAWTQKPLRYGLIILLFSGLIFILLNSARRQNPVPYKTPYVNDLLDYSESLVHTYRKSVNFKYLCSQKIAYFLNMIREHYYFTEVNFNDKFAEQLHSKSKVPLADCVYLVNYINQISQKGYCTSEQFRTLASLIDNFYLKSKLYGQL